MSNNLNTRQGILFAEHEVLGAEFKPDEHGVLRPISYGHKIAEDTDPLTQSTSCMLADMDGAYISFVEGKDAPRFIEMLMATYMPQEGHISLGCTLTGDAHIVSFPYIAQLSSGSYLILDYTKRISILSWWVEFVQHMQNPQTQQAIFEDLSITDEQDTLIPLSLRGDKASYILNDYSNDIPHIAGSCSYTLFDGHIPTYVFCLAQNSYILITPTSYAKILWRSFLSFQELDVETTEDVLRAERMYMPARVYATTSDTLYVEEDRLKHIVNLRDTSDFIGARSLRTHTS